MGDLECLEVGLDGGAGDAESGRGPGDLELPRALAEEVLEQRVEPVHVAKGEQALDVPRKEGVHPLPPYDRECVTRCQRLPLATGIDAYFARPEDLIL